ncbi:MAG: Hsp20/alpha crystallin family protein [Nitrospirae bacterium]|nr:Hsp20/alpha crystallin family protein [Nitrospirota bacterium]
MAVKGLKELVKRERPRALAPLYDIEQWFEETWKRPFSLLSPYMWSDLRTEMYDISPTVDIYEEGNEWIMKADLPGIKKDDIKVDLSENVLTISGEKKKTEKIERENYCRSERVFGSFYRRFELPSDLDTEKVKAHYEDGTLELRIPMKKEYERKHKKISID